jgi:hypothetical protein
MGVITVGGHQVRGLFHHQVATKSKEKYTTIEEYIFVQYLDNQ